jgi:hypothetical protein
MMTKKGPDLLQKTRTRLAQAKERLRHVVDEADQERADFYGLLAATEKREAEIIHLLLAATQPPDADQTAAGSSPTPATDTGRRELEIEMRKLLHSARKFYRKAFDTDRAKTWAIVQALTLTLVLEHKVLPDEMNFANVISEWDIAHSIDPQKVVWGHSNQIELRLLELLARPVAEPQDEANKKAVEEASKKTLASADKLVTLCDSDAQELLSLRQQLNRYIEWWLVVYKYANGEVVKTLTKRILEVLPADPRFTAPE